MPVCLPLLVMWHIHDLPQRITQPDQNQSHFGETVYFLCLLFITLSILFTFDVQRCISGVNMCGRFKTRLLFHSREHRPEPETYPSFYWCLFQEKLSTRRLALSGKGSEAEALHRPRFHFLKLAPESGTRRLIVLSGRSSQQLLSWFTWELGYSPVSDEFQDVGTKQNAGYGEMGSG